MKSATPALSLLGLVAAGLIAGAGFLAVRPEAPARAQAGQGAPATPLAPLPKQPAGVPFPGADWPAGPLPGGADGPLARALDRAFADSAGPMGETRAVLIVQGGRIVAERYGAGFDAESKLVSWSMAKSVTAALVGVGVRDGVLRLDDPLAHPRWPAEDPRAAITIRQALHMADGLRWNEEGYDDPIRNDAARMLFGPGRENIAAYAAGKSLAHEPGTVWNYSSGTTNLIAAALARRIGADPLRDPTGKEAFRNFMVDRLFRPIGMTSAAPEFDIAGNLYASSLIHATARDWARFGLLHLRDGLWGDTRILPEGWVDFVRTPATAQGATIYGAHWWLSPPNGQGLLKKGPHDAFSANGYQGQRLLIVPSRDLIVVRLGLMRDEAAGNAALSAWMQEVVDAIPAPAGRPGRA